MLKKASRISLIVLPLGLASGIAADYSAPAGTRPAIHRPGAPSILPGGRIIAPLGHQYITGPGPFGLAVSPDGKTIISVNSGPERFSVSVLEKEKSGSLTVHHWVTRPPPRHQEERREDSDEWRSVFMGAAFAGNKVAFVAEGNSGRVRLLDLATGTGRKLYDLNQDGFQDSYTGDLAFDPARMLLYVLDQANFRLVVLDTKKGRVVSSLKVGRLPFAIALSPDKRTAYVTNIGMFQYSLIQGADSKSPQDTGLPFPAFGFPSPEARDG
ncbi:MAG TPA: hypothetical protein VNY30_05485, partial [Bryobacteraceae bacterium]|nr:hypothetical protein [Bryobacteraceae bacterium]